MTTTLRVETPEKFLPLYTAQVRYKVFHGGRGSAKSWQVARALLVKGHESPLRILCAREYQTSIKDSVHRLLSDQVQRLRLEGAYEVQQSLIRHRLTGTEFLFKGLRRDIGEIKSTEGIDICWVEEAEKVSDESWRVLIPTIRKESSEIWITFNPAEEGDPTYQRFVVNPPESSLVIPVSWKDNPWLPEVLRREALALQKRDPEAFAHVWGGEPWRRSDAQVLSGKCCVEEFEPGASWDGPYFGADFGFARDPSVLVKVWIADGRLWVDRQVGGVELGNDETAALFRTVPDSEDYVIRGDSSRPETIEELRRRGFRMQSADKWPGSVEDGIQHLRSYEQIVIHPRCELAIQEARLWRYKVDRLTGDVLPKLQDGYDHVWDAVRYALAPLIKQGSQPWVLG